MRISPSRMTIRRASAGGDQRAVECDERGVELDSSAVSTGAERASRDTRTLRAVPRSPSRCRSQSSASNVTPKSPIMYGTPRFIAKLRRENWETGIRNVTHSAIAQFNPSFSTR